MRITALCLACLAAGTQAGTRLIEGSIVGVHDGDTITLLDANNRQHKIRLDGIYSPELGQPFERAARQHLVGLAANRQVIAECSKTDRYGREVCRVLVAGIDTGLAQIQEGLAWFFRRLRQGAATRSTPALHRHEGAGRAAWAVD